MSPPPRHRALARGSSVLAALLLLAVGAAESRADEAASSSYG